MSMKNTIFTSQDNNVSSVKPITGKKRRTYKLQDVIELLPSPLENQLKLYR